MTKLQFFSEFSLTSELKRLVIEYECLNDAYNEDTIPCLKFIRENLDRESENLKNEKSNVYLILMKNSYLLQFIHFEI